MEVISGKILKAKKVVIYGPEGVGKSVLASKFPEPLFFDVEGSTYELDVKRAPKASSWTMLLDQIRQAMNEQKWKTLVVDTVDWAERMCVEHICSTHHKKGIEDFGYGNGYVYVSEEIGRFLNLLQDVVDAGKNVVLTAHSQIRKFEQPDEMGAYDRYELKLGKKTSSQTAPLVKEWADMILFANYEVHSIATDDKGKKHKAQGGRRVMHTSHHPCWDAKNRSGLPDKIPLEWEAIAHLFEPKGKPEPEKPEPEKPAAEPINKGSTESKPQEPDSGAGGEQMNLPLEKEDKPEETKGFELITNPKIPKALRDLMNSKAVDEWTLQTVVADRGYYPEGTPIENYDPEFVKGVLVAAWDQVYKEIQNLREEIPFN